MKKQTTKQKPPVLYPVYSITISNKSVPYWIVAANPIEALKALLKINKDVTKRCVEIIIKNKGEADALPVVAKPYYNLPQN